MISSPIDAPFDLSGTFGEYRSDFIRGLTSKAEVQGQKIFSIEEGYISRIEVMVWVWKSNIH